MQKTFFIFLWITLPKLCLSQEVKVVDWVTFEQMVEQPSQKVKIINFWATWCKPCIEEIPIFLEFGEKHPETEIWFVSMDFPSEIKKVETFAIKKRLKGKLLLLNAPDYNEWIIKVSEKWQGAIPATWVVDNIHKEKKFYEGSLQYSQLEKLLNQ